MNARARLRLIARAVRRELVELGKVVVPELRDVRREREILTDEDIAQFFACGEVDIEIRLMGVVARIEGGMRTRDLTAWDWRMIDRESFAWCVVPRTKTGRPHKLEIPEVLRGPLRRWWEDHGAPSQGPVFPVTRGRRKGEARKAQGVSFADRLRRALHVAGVKRHACARPGVAHTRVEPCCPVQATDPLFYESQWSLPVDFHSFRRARSRPRSLKAAWTGDAPCT